MWREGLGDDVTWPESLTKAGFPKPETVKMCRNRTSVFRVDEHDDPDDPYVAGYCFCANVAGPAFASYQAIAEELAERCERLEVCGNCATFHTWPDYGLHCAVWEALPVEISCSGDWPEPSKPCALTRHGMESQWTERKP